MNVSKLKIIFAGSGEFGLPTLSALREAGHEIVLVVSQPDRPAGRGRGLTPTPVGAMAIQEGLALVRTGDINAEPLPPADLMVVIAFGQKISDAVVHHPRLGSVNLHASILPRHRGAAPINWAILSGETVAGNSVIRLAQKMDAGAVLGQSELPIGELETAGELHDRLSLNGAPLVLRVVGELSAGKAVEREQEPALATIAPKLSRDSTRLDFTRPAAEIGRRIRGLYPWPGCRVMLCDAAGDGIDTVRLVRAKPVESDEVSRWAPGEIMTDGAIACGGGTALQIVELQPDGKRPMALADYRRGHHWNAGMHLVSKD